MIKRKRKAKALRQLPAYNLYKVSDFVSISCNITPLAWEYELTSLPARIFAPIGFASGVAK